MTVFRLVSKQSALFLNIACDFLNSLQHKRTDVLLKMHNSPIDNQQVMRWFRKSESDQVQKSRDELQTYWKHPDAMNDPAGYFQGGERGEFMVSLVKQYVKPNASIIELGCNVGRNLHQLWLAGYRNLAGVEINEDAVRLMKERFPEMQPIIYQGSIEDRIKELQEYDLVFTIAVLEHIHRDSEWVFPEIAKRARMLITIEGEKKNVSELHFPRNYKNVFEASGLRQIYEKHLSHKEGLNTKFYARVFEKKISSSSLSYDARKSPLELPVCYIWQICT